nr:RNA-directed DNA polymerase, eukaryota, reverse transcriptase zinc-binding domain protein [Tanacetum cinerariifolium]
MGDSDWHEVIGRKHRSVFDRLTPSQSLNSNVDDLAKISLSVGTVADVYIAKRKNKFGQMFAFCRYIKVVNIENLISSSSNIWVGKLRLHANVARFDKKMDAKPSYAGVKVKPPVVTRSSHPPSNKTTSYANVAKASCDVGNKGSIYVDKECGDQTQVINIPMSSSQDLPLAVLGCYKDFRSIANARSLCHSEARNSYLKHDGIRSWFSSSKPWHDDFTVDERLIWLSKCLCIKSKHNPLVFAIIFMTLTNVTYAIRVRELCSWTPAFVEIDSNREDEEMQSNDGTDVVSVGGLSLDVNGEVQINADDIHDQAEEANIPGSDHEPQQHDLNSDPFGLEPLINKKVGTEAASQSSVTPMFPPGFSLLPDDDVAGHSDAHHCIKPPDSESSHSSHGVNKQIGFSMLERLEETIKIGTTLGLNMEGCFGDLSKRKWVRELCHKYKVNFLSLQETKLVHVDLWILRQVWGNTHFDFASMSSRGLSGGIICLWNKLIFRKTSISCNENYVAIEDLWIPNNVRIMWIAVYAHQALQDKIALWSSISNLTRNWDGILIALGHFNMVREAGERFGSTFNERHADIFNAFIFNSSLIDIPLGGYKFTWTDKWGSKMSKLDRFLVSKSFYDAFPHNTGVILEKGILDHRPILLKEHSKCDGIIKTNGLVSFKKKLQNLKRVIRDWIATKKHESTKLKHEHVLRLATIDAKIDNGIANDLDFENRRESIKVLGEVDRFEASDLAQKARIKWAMEGDENTSFFQAMLKKHRRQLAIKGRNILDVSLILNEVMNWYRKRKEKLMIFKVDFEKAFDSLRWDFLDTIMEKLRFGSRWSVWIKGCFVNARLHALVCKAINVGIFKGASVGNEHLRVSHLIYADDVIFVGQWSVTNVPNLLCILRCFFLVSGLRINVHKCSLLGACVSEEEVSDMASIIGCGAATFPLTYLGVPVGCNMALCKI